MHMGTIVVKNKDGMVPDDLLSSILKTHGAYVGMAYAIDGHVHVTKLKKTVPFATIKGALEKFKDKMLMSFFGSSSDELIEMADVQPFVLLEDEKKNPLVVAYLDGDFSQFDKADSTHSGQYFAVQNYIIPRISKMWKYAGGDFTKFTEELRDATFEQDIVNTMIGDRGSIAFLTGNGDVEIYSVAGDDSTIEGDWGWSSDDHEEEPVAAEAGDELLSALTAPTAKTEVPKGSARSLQTSKPVVTSSSGPLPGLPANNSAGKDDSAIPQSPKLKPEDETEIIDVPSQLKGKKRSRWFRKRLDGFIPPNSTNVVKIKVKKDVLETLAKRTPLTKTFKEALADQAPATETVEVKPVKLETEAAPPRATGGKSSRTVGGKPAAAPSVPTVPAKDTTVHGNKQVSTEPLPVIPPAQLAEIRAVLDDKNNAAAIDRNSQLIQDPAEFTKIETSVPDFATQLNHPKITCLEDTKNIPLDMLFAMGQSCPRAAVVWGYNWMVMALKLMEANKEADVTGNGVVETETDPAHTEQPVIEEPVVVEQKSNRRSLRTPRKAA